MSLLLERPTDEFRLGCGNYEYAIKSRCGTFHLLGFDTAQTNWSRTLNGVSTAKCQIPAPTGCGRDLGRIRPWGHELWIYRNGAVVWVGPVTNVSWEGATCTIEAADLMHWASVREIHKNVDFTGVCAKEASEVFTELCTEGFAYEPICLTLDVGPVGSMAEMFFKAGEHKTLLSQVNELSRGLVDWTVYCRRLIGGSRLGRFVGRLSDNDFTSTPAIAQRASDTATRVTVIGESNLVVGQVGAVDTFYGLVERTFKLPNLKDAAAAQAAAQRIWDEMHYPPVECDDNWATDLMPTSPCRIEDLVPGNLFAILLTSGYRDVDTMMRMTRLEVAVDEGAESVKLAMAATTAGFEWEGIADDV